MKGGVNKKMGMKNWFSKRREQKEKQQRFEELSEDEIQALQETEKSAYLGIAKKQVTYRGKINAYKDFPIENGDKQEIDIEDKDNKIDEEENEEEDNEPEIEINDEEEETNADQTIKQM